MTSADSGSILRAALHMLSRSDISGALPALLDELRGVTGASVAFFVTDDRSSALVSPAGTALVTPPAANAGRPLTGLAGRPVRDLSRAARRPATGDERILFTTLDDPRDRPWATMGVVAPTADRAPGWLSETAAIVQAAHRAERMWAYAEALDNAITARDDELFVFDADLSLAHLNAVARRRTGVDERHQPVRRNDVLIDTAPEELHARLAPLGCSDEAPRALSFDAFQRRHDGQAYPVSVGVSRMRGASPMYVSVVRDMSTHDALLARLRQMEHRYSLGHLAAELTYEFTQELTVVRGYAKLLQRRLDASGGPGVEDAEAIVAASNKAVALLHRLSLVANGDVERGAIDVAARCVDIALASAPGLGPGIKLRTLNSIVGPREVYMSSDDLELMLSEMIGQARAALAGEGHIAVTLADITGLATDASPCLLPGVAYVALGVADDRGATWSSSRAGRRIDASLVETVHRSLALVHSLAASVGGGMSVRTSDAGVSCVVYLPLASAAAGVAVPPLVHSESPA